MLAPEAIAAAEHAITADPAAETAYALVARGHLAVSDPEGARRAIDRCRAALAEVCREPTAHTVALAQGSR